MYFCMSDYKYDLLEMNCDDALSSDKSALNIKSGSEKNKAHYIGHRARLRQKLLNNGADSIPDYELLEMILTIALPRMDVKPLAKKLLNKFGNFAEVINASPDDLSKISGVKETTIAVLKIIQGAIVRVLKTELKQMPVINNWDKLIDYCRLNISYEPNEQFRVLYLDSKLKLISDELQQQGTINYAVVYPREVVKQAVSNGATGAFRVQATVQRTINGETEIKQSYATVYLVDFTINGDETHIAGTNATATYNGREYDVLHGYVNATNALDFNYSINPEEYSYDVNDIEEAEAVFELEEKLYRSKGLEISFLDFNARFNERL